VGKDSVRQAVGKDKKQFAVYSLQFLVGGICIEAACILGEIQKE
jgi:hypothetical protein